MAFFHRFLLLLIVCSFFTAESAELWYNACNDESNANSTQLSSNIDTLLTQLVAGTILNGYVATSYGNSKDVVYGLAQCRGHVGREDCATCIRAAAKEIRQLCPTQSDARIWYDSCFMRYNTNKFAGVVDTTPGLAFYNVGNVTDPGFFKKRLGDLTEEITFQAVKPENRGLGEGKIKLSKYENIYSLVQCTRDLSPFACAHCLATATGSYDTVCGGKKGCRVLSSSCVTRYELYPFYNNKHS